MTDSLYAFIGSASTNRFSSHARPITCSGYFKNPLDKNTSGFFDCKTTKFLLRIVPKIEFKITDKATKILADFNCRVCDYCISFAH